MTLTWALVALSVLMVLALVVMIGAMAMESALHPSELPVKAVGVVALVVLLGMALIFGSSLARAEGATEDLGAWFRSLTIPGTEMSCCSEADCSRVQHRTTGEGYEALIEGQWMKVPPAAILHRMANPTGSAIACYLPHRGIMCFVRPAEA